MTLFRRSTLCFLFWSMAESACSSVRILLSSERRSELRFTVSIVGHLTVVSNDFILQIFYNIFCFLTIGDNEGAV